MFDGFQSLLSSSLSSAGVRVRVSLTYRISSLSGRRRSGFFTDFFFITCEEQRLPGIVSDVVSRCLLYGMEFSFFQTGCHARLKFSASPAILELDEEEMNLNLFQRNLCECECKRLGWIRKRLVLIAVALTAHSLLVLCFCFNGNSTADTTTVTIIDNSISSVDME